MGSIPVGTTKTKSECRNPFNVKGLRLFYLQAMVWVYAIKSELDGTLYVGISEDIERRLREHNLGKSKYSKGHRPWALVYSEMADGWENARKREKYLKTGVGKKWLKALLSDPDFKLE